MVVPPVHAIAERRVIEHLRRYGAVTPDKAMGYAPVRFTHARALARLRAAGVVNGESSALWLDESAWAARRSTRRKRALAFVAISVVGAGIAGLASLK